jgi:MraZ protein
MLLGTYPTKILAGHRVVVPAVFRQELGKKYILARWYEGCLVLIGEGRWDALYKRLTGEEKVIVTPVRDTERFILGSAYEVVPDEQGRIIIPEILISYSKLGEEICFIGLGDKIEIWNKNTWTEKEKEVIRESAGYIEQLAKKNNG